MTHPLNLSTQFKIFDPDIARPVTLIGAGSVGSEVARQLTKIGVTDLTVYDDDYVESHNIPSSCFRVKDCGRPKVEALIDIIEEQTGIEINVFKERFDADVPPLKGAVIACVDSMEARQEIWKNVKGRPDVDILIDTRVSEELVWVFAIHPCDPEDIELYEHHLAYSSKEAAPPMCGRHGIIYVASTAARAAIANLTNWWQSGNKKQLHKELVGTLLAID